MAENKKQDKIEENKEVSEVKVEEVKKEEPKKTAVKVEKSKEETPELEREYVIPMRKRILKVPRYKRAKRAIRTIQQFLAKHMKVEGRDIRKVKIDMYLNEEMWFRGIKNPLTKIKVKAKKIKGIVYAELAEVPEVVQFKMNKAKKLKERLASIGTKKPKIVKEKVEEKSSEQKVEEKEKEKAGAESDSKANKMEATVMKHETGGSHAKKTQPRRQALKK